MARAISLNRDPLPTGVSQELPNGNPAPDRRLSSLRGAGLLGTTSFRGDSVYNVDGKFLGEIEEVLLDVHSGRVAYARISAPGLLVSDQKSLAIPWSTVTVDLVYRRCFTDIDCERPIEAPSPCADILPRRAAPRWETGLHAVTLETETPIRDSPTLSPWTVVHDVNRGQRPGLAVELPKLCLAEGLDAPAKRQFDELLTARIRLRKGETLFRAGDQFASLYAIRSGSCKTVAPSAHGHDQVAGYHMPGEIVGTDGVGTEAHGCRAVALEDTELWALSFERLADLSRRNLTLQHNLYLLLAREIARTRALLQLLGTMRAEQRLAAFLMDLSQRYHALGYSSCEFVLRMTRDEIGSYLGLQLETVSRLFSRFQRDGLVQIQGRLVKLLDRTSIKRVLDSSD